MLNRKKYRIIALSLFSLPAMVMAQDLTQKQKEPVVNPPVVNSPAPAPDSTPVRPPAPKNYTASQIADTNERIALLSARLAELEMQVKIANKMTELKQNEGSGVDETFIPTVMDIDGVDGRLRASLYVRGGNIQSVRVGDEVGAWRVKDIKFDSVTVQKGKEVIHLGFGSASAQIPQSPGQQNYGIGMPPMVGR